MQGDVEGPNYSTSNISTAASDVWQPGDAAFLVDLKGRRCGLVEIVRSEPAGWPEEDRTFVVMAATPIINQDKSWQGMSLVVQPEGAEMRINYSDLVKPETPEQPHTNTNRWLH